jgi:hypothetical protein
MKTTLLILTTVWLTSCATATDSFKGPNGRAAYVVRCGSAVLSACYEKAGALCPNGYNPIDRDGGAVVMPLGGGFVRGPNQLMIECKAEG